MVNGIRCPVCGGKIMERNKSFSCSRWKKEDGGCKFTIWKKSFGATFDEEDIIRLFQGERVPKINISEDGNPYPVEYTLDNHYGAKFHYIAT